MTNDVAVVILAGGEGKRIGGGKPLKIYRGQRLIDRAINRARSWSDTIAVAVRDRSQLAAVAAELIPDADVAGPLGGLISGMNFALAQEREFLLAIPADMPFLPDDLLDGLRLAIGHKDCALAESGGQLHPVCGLWRSNALGATLSYAASGRRSLKGLAACVSFATVDWPTEPLDPYFNINTSEDLAEAARGNR